MGGEGWDGKERREFEIKIATMEGEINHIKEAVQEVKAELRTTKTTIFSKLDSMHTATHEKLEAINLSVQVQCKDCGPAQDIEEHSGDIKELENRQRTQEQCLTKIKGEVKGIYKVTGAIAAFVSVLIGVLGLYLKGRS